MRTTKLFDFMMGLLLAAMTIWLITFTAPKIYDLYFNKPETIKTDTIYHQDTIYITNTHTDTLFKTKNIITHKTDTIHQEDNDSDIIINLNQKQLTNTLQMGVDTITYNAYISGRSYEGEDYPTLDSINFALSVQHIEEVETITIEKIIKQRQSKWHISPYIGYGWSPRTNTLEPTIGLGLNYNIW